jgi:hypothetical protein
VNPGGPPVSEQHSPAAQSASQLHSARQAPFTQVDRGEQVSENTDELHAPPSLEPLLNTQTPVGAAVCVRSTSHCWNGLHPVLRIGSQTAIGAPQPRASGGSPGGAS